MILVLLLLGAAIGIAWSRWLAMETQLSNHNARLIMLETDRAKRLQLKACAGVVASVASKCLHKLTFGLLKIH